jgi:hypothetical protein
MTNEEAQELNKNSALDNGRKLAFPNDNLSPFHEGLTKREYMATQLLSGLLSQNTVDVKLAVDMTDKLLIELSRNK